MPRYGAVRHIVETGHAARVARGLRPNPMQALMELARCSRDYRHTNGSSRTTTATYIMLDPVADFLVLSLIISAVFYDAY